MATRKLPVLFKAIASGAGLFGVGVGTIYMTRPDILVGIVTDWQRLRLGLRRKHVVLNDGFKLYYAERGRPQEAIPTMVMLHGFSGSLDAAVPVIKRLPPDRHVIAIDAPGHGKTKHVNETDLRPRVMAQRVHQFITKKKLDEKKFHLVGWAMGGTIAGFYAAQFASDLKLLTLIAPGMCSPITSRPMKETVDGDTRVLLPVSDAEQRRLWKEIVMYKNNDLPKPVSDYLQRKKLLRRKDHLKVMKTMIEDAVGKEDNLFIKDVRKIRTPTQIIWGDKDALQHISGADLLVSTIGHHVKRKDVIEECGHAFYAEEPYTLAGLLVAFQMDYRLNSTKWAGDSKDNERDKSGKVVTQTWPDIRSQVEKI